MSLEITMTKSVVCLVFLASQWLLAVESFAPNPFLLGQPRSRTHLFYEPPTNPSESSVWSVLSTTEQWISNILGKPGLDNPYQRKELSYVCEVQEDDALMLSGIWRRLREARELGERHAAQEIERQDDALGRKTSSPSPATFRQTQVIVVPNCPAAGYFPDFDKLVQAVNQARRQARDLLTGLVLEKNEEKLRGEYEMDWSVSINLAHMHPRFGEKTNEEILAELRAEEQAGEVDENLRAYKEKRLLARRSPFPTVVMEVRATPSPDFGDSPPPPRASNRPAQVDGSEGVTAEDVQRLEAIFGKSAALNVHDKEPTEKDEDAFYDKLSSTIGIEEITILSPMILAQNWVKKHDPKLDTKTSTFTSTDAKHPDTAYEFVFTNIAMHTNSMKGAQREKGIRQYLVMNEFLSNSATSFEKFANSVKAQLDALPIASASQKCQVEILHPEHVQKSKRAPCPIFVIDWSEEE